MISPAYIATQWRAVIAMAQDNPAWRDRLDTDTDGFYRSFWSVLLTLPAVVISFNATLRLRDGIPSLAAQDLGMPVGVLVGLQLLTTLLGWAGAVILLGLLARGMKADRQVSPLIVGYNWSEMLIQWLMAACLLLVSFGPELLVFLVIGAFIFTVYLRWGVLRRALQANVVQTMAVMFMLFLVQMVTSLVLGAIGDLLFATAGT